MFVFFSFLISPSLEKNKTTQCISFSRFYFCVCICLVLQEKYLFVQSFLFIPLNLSWRAVSKKGFSLKAVNFLCFNRFYCFGKKKLVQCGVWSHVLQLDGGSAE